MTLPRMAVHDYCMYVLHTCRMFPEFSRWEPAYGLVVSLGRSVEVFPVSCSYQTDTAGFQCHVENTTNGAYFSHMKAMIKYYQ